MHSCEIDRKANDEISFCEWIALLKQKQDNKGEILVAKVVLKR